MIDGSNWPIPGDELIDGSNLAINNANRLLDIANEVYRIEKYDYGTCIFLCVLALEELGKGIMLHKAEENNEIIDKNKWSKKFEVHKPKIKASIDFIKEFVDDSDPDRDQKLNSLDELEQYSLDILNEKMASIYVDWDANANDWVYVKERSDILLRADAERLLKHANWMISNFTKSPPYRVNTILELVKSKFVQAQCRICDFKSFDANEIKEHSKLKSKGHDIGFRELEDRTKGRLSF